jgi:hypothetical protein
MKHEDWHFSDQQLLQDIDGELSLKDGKAVREHLAACWKCRTRRQEIENAITDFVRGYRREFHGKLPPAAGPRALLKARLAELASAEPAPRSFWLPASTWLPTSAGLETAAAICVLLVVGFVLARLIIERQQPSNARTGIVWIPDSRLTPGATVLVNRPSVCAQPNTKNKVVPAAMRRLVFAEYGIAGADPRRYEVDYLVTPALGGADDIHNLWPHSHSATVWNAEVKDALEDRLREMVCDGSLDLAEAQREIAVNWITAYKKYFHTEKPLAEHCRRCSE